MTGDQAPAATPDRARAVAIAVLDDYQGVAHRFATWSDLDGRATVTMFGDHLHDPDALVDRLAPFQVVVAMRERTAFPRHVLERLPALRLLVTTGMGNAAIDMAAARDLGIAVSGTGGMPTPTAELTWALILGLVRHVAEEDRQVRQGGWQHHVGTDLAGATLGVVGLGRLGAQVATIGRAFGMRVIAWSQNLQPTHAYQLGVDVVTKEELFSTSDIVTIHLVLSARSRGLVSAADIASMKPTAFLVNTSRGPIVDEAALIDALHAGALAGAGLDVFEVEPIPPDHPVRAAPRTLLTPHIGYVTTETYQVFYGQALEDIVAFLAGTPIRVLNA